MVRVFLGVVGDYGIAAIAHDISSSDAGSVGIVAACVAAAPTLWRGCFLIILIYTLEQWVPYLQAQRNQGPLSPLFAEDGNLALRVVTPDDALAVLELNIAEFDHLKQGKHQDQVGTTHAEVEATLSHQNRARLSGRLLRLGIWERRDNTDHLIGFIMLTSIEQTTEPVLSLSYALAEGHQGRGIMTRMCGHVLGYSFETCHARRVQLIAAPDNTRSIALAERLGFEREGLLREAATTGEHAFDVFIFGLLATQWTARAEVGECE
jgi:ribosomal-protein-serine acetyltransferase